MVYGVQLSDSLADSQRGIRCSGRSVNFPDGDDTERSVLQSKYFLGIIQLIMEFNHILHFNADAVQYLCMVFREIRIQPKQRVLRTWETILEMSMVFRTGGNYQIFHVISMYAVFLADDEIFLESVFDGRSRNLAVSDDSMLCNGYLDGSILYSILCQFKCSAIIIFGISGHACNSCSNYFKENS